MANQKTIKTTAKGTSKTVKAAKAPANKAKAAPAKAPKDTRKVVPVVMPKFQEPVALAAKARDPRLPEVGTAMTKTYKGIKVTVVEGKDGRFTLTAGDSLIVENAKSISAAVATYLTSLGLTSSVNGYFWMGLCAGDKAPRKPRNPLAALGAAVTKAQARLDALKAKVIEAETAVSRAQVALEQAVAAQPTPAE